MTRATAYRYDVAHRYEPETRRFGSSPAGRPNPVVVACPKPGCKTSYDLWTEALASDSEAAEHRRSLEAQMSRNCPRHPEDIDVAD